VLQKKVVSAYPKEVTGQMVFNFLRGGAGINVLAKHAGAEILVVDIGVDFDFDPSVFPLSKEGIKGGLGGLFVSRKVIKGTKNIRKGTAMTREESERCIQVGIELASEYVKRDIKSSNRGHGYCEHNTIICDSSSLNR